VAPGEVLLPGAGGAATLRLVNDPLFVASFFTLSGAGFGEPARHGFAARCEAAAAAGFGGIGLHFSDLARTIDGGLNVDGMRAVLADTGLAVVEIEFLGGWALDPEGQATDLNGMDAVATTLGGRHVSAGEFRGGMIDPEAAGRGLARVAARAAERDLLVAVESFPWSAIRDYATAIDLVRRSGAANVGLLVDVWHFFNGGATLEVLRELPGAGVAAVQLNDGPRVHEDFLVNARATRRLPGDGELDVIGLVRAVEQAGFTGPYCVEVNTPEFRALPVAEAAQQAVTAAADIVRRARSESL
jgi:sugar phosphate isomerase/epimerase